MNPRISVVIFSISLFILAVFSNNVAAENNAESVDTFMEQADELLSRGDVGKAIATFSRALLLDPQNKDLQKKLNALTHDVSLSGQTRMQLFHVSDLLAYIMSLRHKIDYMEERSILLQADLIKGGADPDELNQELMRLRKGALSQDISQQLKFNESLFQERPLEVVAEVLLIQKEKLFQQLSGLQKQYYHLHQWQQNIVRAGRAVSSPEPEPVLEITTPITIPLEQIQQPLSKARTVIKEHEQTKEEELPELTSEVSRDDAEEPPSPEQIKVLKQDLALVRRDLDDLQQHVQDKDAKVTDLTKEVVDSSLRLSETEVVNRQNADELAAFKNELTDLQSRLELGQKIIEEKETKIQSLQTAFEELAETTKRKDEELNDILSSKDEKLIEVNGILQIYKGLLRDTSKKINQNKGRLLSLQNQVSFLQDQMSSKDSVMDTTKRELTTVGSKLIGMQERLTKLREYEEEQQPLVIQMKLQKEISLIKAELEEIHKILLYQLNEIENLNAFRLSDLTNMKILHKSDGKR